MPQRREQELRCFCRTKPLLATFGLDAQGKLFIRIKVYKGDRIYAESVHYGGVVKLKCRNCLRWQNVIFRNSAAQLQEDHTNDPQVTGS